MNRLPLLRRKETAKARTGRRAEDLVAADLRKRGWKILERNFSEGRDEVDLICRDGQVLVFVEVRARQANALVSGYHSVRSRKKTALKRVCRAYLKALGSRRPAHFRFDIAEVRLGQEEKTLVNLFENVPLFDKHDR